MINSEFIPINGILINIRVALIRFISFTLMLWSFCGGIIPSGCGSGEMGLFGYAEEWEAQPTVWILVSTSVHQYMYVRLLRGGGLHTPGEKSVFR